MLLCAAIELGGVPVVLGIAIASVASACHPPESPPPVPPKPTDPTTSRATVALAPAEHPETRAQGETDASIVADAGPILDAAIGIDEGIPNGPPRGLGAP
jgi:hypothetical protein